jgi:hypothetical protein
LAAAAVADRPRVLSRTSSERVVALVSSMALATWAQAGPGQARGAGRAGARLGGEGVGSPSSTRSDSATRSGSVRGRKSACRSRASVPASSSRGSRDSAAGSGGRGVRGGVL